MNLLVMSDSHRVLRPVTHVLDTFASQVSAVAHLGDHANDLLQHRPAYPKLAMHAVAGNCDGGGEPEQLLRFGGKRILLIHGHRHHVKMSYDRLIYYAQEQEADACLFGHTHEPAVFEFGPILFLNPGSIGQPRAGAQATYGLLTVSDAGVIKAKVFTLPNGAAFS